MEIIDQRTIFNNTFITQLKGDRSDYLNKLLTYLSTDPNLEGVIEERIEDFQKSILGYVLSTENEDDYEEDIDDVRKNKVNTILFNINNYFISLEPSDAVDRFINDPFKSIIQDAELYTDMYRRRIADKVKTVSETTIPEIEGSRIYKQMVELLTGYIDSPASTTIRYGSMNKNIINLNVNTPLVDVESYVDDLINESLIINKFDNKARNYILRKLEETNQSHEERVYNQIDANICESILMNYTLLSIYSNHPEKLIVTENMLKTLLFELSNGTVTKDDIIVAIEEGPIKFSKEEINYITRNFINKLFGNDKNTLSADHIIKLVK